MLGEFFLGLGLGTGWAHRLTQYPANLGAALLTAGMVATLVASLLARKRK